MKNSIGILGHLTRWLAPVEIDRAAQLCGVSINVGQKHEVVLPNGQGAPEIRSEAKSLENMDDETADFLSEFFQIRMWRTLAVLANIDGARSIDPSAIAREYLYELAFYWGISGSNLGELVGLPTQEIESYSNLLDVRSEHVNKQMAAVLQMNDQPETQFDDSDPFNESMRLRVVQRIWDRVEGYFGVDEFERILDGNLRSPETLYSVPITPEAPVLVGRTSYLDRDSFRESTDIEYQIL